MTNESMTERQALDLYESKFWESMTLRERAMFQINHKRLCMPFGVFHEAVEKTLGRPVYTHEFGLAWEELKAELNGFRDPPTLDDIINMIPADKRVIVLEKESDDDPA